MLQQQSHVATILFDATSFEEEKELECLLNILYACSNIFPTFSCEQSFIDVPLPLATIIYALIQVYLFICYLSLLPLLSFIIFTIFSLSRQPSFINLCCTYWHIYALCCMYLIIARVLFLLFVVLYLLFFFIYYCSLSAYFKIFTLSLI